MLSTIEWVWPWWRKQGNLSYDDALPFVEQRLGERGFRLHDQALPEKEQAACEEVLHTCAEGNWAVLLLNSDRLLSTFERIIPVTYSLTFKRSSDIISTGELIHLFRLRQTKDIWSEDPAGERLSELETARLLVWRKINLPVQGSARYASAFDSFLSFRVENIA